MEGRTSGEELARVALYYGLISDTSALNQKTVCPIHEDVNPSMMVNLDNGMFHCFGCGCHGDARYLVRMVERKHHNASDIQCEYVYQHIQRTTEVKPLNIPSVVKRKAVSREKYAIAYDYYHGLKKVPWKRSGELDEESKAVRDYMVDRGFLPDTLERLGAKVTYTDPYQLIFPIMDNGKFKGWVSRTADEEVAKYRKYLYNKGFSRANTVVGEYGDRDYVYVVEGFMDRAKLIQLGLDNVVAIFGWKMSPMQIKKLKDAGVTKIISALDNDEPGRKGTRWLKQNFDSVTRWRYLKGIKDPGDMEVRSFSRMHDKTMQDFRREK